MITGPLHSIPSPRPPNPERLGIFLAYIADVLMELEQEAQAAQRHDLPSKSEAEEAEPVAAKA